MKDSMSILGVVLAPFLAIFLFMGVIEVMWPVARQSSNGSAPAAATTDQAQAGTPSGSRPSRPRESILGHWKDAGADVYVSTGSKGLLCTWTFTDGEIEEHDMVVKGENAKDGVLTLSRWYRADQRSGGKPAGVGTFSDGREMTEEWRFDGDRKSFTVWALHFTDGMTQRQTMRYIDAKQKP